ncbi:hypothetical protein EMCRGX_G034087 [Ephydatia muelleri]
MSFRILGTLYIFPRRQCLHSLSSLGAGRSGDLLQNHAHSLSSSAYLHQLSHGGMGSANSEHLPHWHDTFISASRAMNEYLLDSEDLEDLPYRTFRNPDNSVKRLTCYLKTDVEKKALEEWGSWQALEQELMKRKQEADEAEKRRKGLSTLIAHLKKHRKEERVTFLKGSARVVAIAVASNFAILLIKLIAYYSTGSASMLSEAIHSLVDALNQSLLAIGIAQSIRQPDPNHPYGFSRARYVYSLISGVGIFFLGAGVTCYHGVLNLVHPPTLEALPIAFSVLGASLLMESVSLWTALKQVRRSADESGVSLKDYVLRGRDPSAVAVLLEDGAAITGIFVATISLMLAHLTLNPVYDAVGSITIGGLLGAVALFLINRNSSALVGRSIPEERLRQIIELIESDNMIRSIHDVKATDLGADIVQFKAEVNFDGREVARIHVSKLNLEELLKEIQSFRSVAELEKFLLEHGEQVIDVLGSEVDRIETIIKKKAPEVRHVDLEIL